VWRPVTAASEKTKQQSNCAASHGCKEKRAINLCGLSRLQGEKNNLVSQVASREGKNNNLAASTETNNKLVLAAANKQTKNTTTINRCGLLRPQQEKKTKQNNNHPVWRPFTAASEKTKQQSNCAASHGRKEKKTINLCGLSRLQEEEKKQSTGESGGESRRKKNNLAASGENNNQPVFAAVNTKKTNNNQPVRPVAAAKRKIQKRKQQSSCAAASCHGPRPQAQSSCAVPVTAASQKNKNQTVQPLAAATKKQQSTFAACRLQGEEKTTINL